jgi:hypothetical protein
MPIEYGVVAAPSNTSAPDASNQPILQGKAGEQILAELHGKWYTAAYRNRVFIGSSLIAGVTIPVNTTTAPTFTLFNPLGSGVNLEMITFDVGWPAAATTVVATLLGSVSTQTPTSTTSGGTTISVPIGAGGVAQGKLFTAATITAITTHIPLLQITSTTDGMVASHYEFDGRLVIAPGGLITITSTPVQTGVAIPSFCWAEWPI